jgi:beta-lactamase class A
MESIYKLYVAYIGYQKIDQGKWNESEIYLNDWTRGKCLDQMIRTSHSPCGEKIMDEIGKANIQDILNSYGLENTSFTQLTTSSDDVANILIRLQKNLDLSPDSTKKLLDSMNGQIHRDALPKGFGDYWKVYDKVGFRDFNEYHDVAIVVTPRGKTYIVSVLSSGAGTTNIADLAETLKKSMTE